MNPFTVIRLRGHLLSGDGDILTVRRDHGNGVDGDGETERRGVFVQKRGPAPPRISIRDTRTPHDLRRSRRVGLSRTVCTECGAIKDQGFCHHKPGCEDPGTWHRQTTGPLAPNETSADAGWR